MQSFRNGKIYLIQQFFEAIQYLPEPKRIAGFPPKQTTALYHLEKDERLKPSKLSEILQNDDETTITIKIMYIIMEVVKTYPSSKLVEFFPFFEYIIELDQEMYNNLLILRQVVYPNQETSRSTNETVDTAFKRMSFQNEIPEWKLFTFLLFSRICHRGFYNEFLEYSTESGNVLQNVPLFQLVLLEYFRRKKANHLSKYSDHYWISYEEFVIVGQTLEFFNQYVYWMDSIDEESDEFISVLKIEQLRMIKMIIEKLISITYELSEVFDFRFETNIGDIAKYLSNIGTKLISTLCSSYFESVQTILQCLGNDFAKIGNKINSDMFCHGKTVGMIKQKIINISGSVIQSMFFSNLLDPFFNTRQIVETVLRSFVDPYLKILLLELQKDAKSEEDVLIKETACKSAGYYSAIFGKLLYQVSLNLNNQFGEYLEHIQFLKNFNDEIIDIMVNNLKDENLNVRKTTCISLSNFLSSREIRPSVFSQIVEYFKYNLDNFRTYSNLITVILKFLHRDNLRDAHTLLIANTFLSNLCEYLERANLDQFKEWKVLTTCVYYLGHNISISILKDFLDFIKEHIRKFLQQKRSKLIHYFLPILGSFLKTAQPSTIYVIEELGILKDLNDLLHLFASKKEYHESFFKLIDGMFMANIFKNLNCLKEETNIVKDFVQPFLSNYLFEKVQVVNRNNTTSFDACVPCIVSFGRMVEYFVIVRPTDEQWLDNLAKESIQTMKELLTHVTLFSLDDASRITDAKINLRVESVRSLILLSYLNIDDVAQIFVDHVDDFFLFDDVPDRFDSSIIEFGFLQLLEYSIDHMKLDMRQSYGDLLSRIDDYIYGEVFSRRSCRLTLHWRRVTEKLKL
ncbi:predicted protein [Naegleria gruberi]|uniref:Predicted protein n=1 Tax=Naegleria gruberi TaxID=5762 RepID=D2W414_NAEGR|nr:uncharacterized protein NAEGRDRAFT_76144 [Naegleria gruberi]EFC36179.1 predicted protein [Naegleria gruberi]|eukprot:XP_002668923.1 predicted protein [Naegleria gruberi strain NEG-M]